MSSVEWMVDVWRNLGIGRTSCLFAKCCQVLFGATGEAHVEFDLDTSGRSSNSQKIFLLQLLVLIPTPDQESALAPSKKADIKWRSFWDGSDETARPICKRWNINEFPTYFVLDEKGVIRYRDVYDEEVDAAIEKLLKEIEHEKQIEYEYDRKCSKSRI